jgi:hypothetical protein
MRYCYLCLVLRVSFKRYSCCKTIQLVTVTNAAIIDYFCLFSRAIVTNVSNMLARVYDAHKKTES